MTALILKYLFGWVSIAVIALLVPAISHGGQADDIPLAARMVIFKAQKLMEKNRYTDAARVLEAFQEKSKTLKPDEADSKGCRHYLINFNLGNCFLMTKKYAAAEARYRAVVVSKPDFHMGWMNLAKCCYDMNAHGKAGHAFLRGYETAPEKDPHTLYSGAICFMTAGDNQKALGVFRNLLKAHPSAIKLEWKETLVQAYLACDQPRKALPFIEALSEKTKGKKRKQWQEIRLNTYLSLNMKTKALQYVNRLILEYPTEARWWKGLAHLHLKENRYKSALVALTVKGFLEPLTIQENRIIADLNMSVNVPLQAVRFYERIAGKKPGSDMAYRIAQCYIRLYRPEEALKYADRGLIKDKSHKHLLLMKGNLLYELKRYPEAAAAFETAARKKANPGRAWLMAGYAAWNAKDLRATRRAFKNAAGHSRQKKAALKALRQLDQETASIMKGGD